MAGRSFLFGYSVLSARRTDIERLMNLCGERAIPFSDIVIDEELRSRLTEITGSSAVSFANSFGGELIFNRLATTDANGSETSLKDEVKLILSIIKEVKQS